jgi:hypothetical protein
VLAQHPTAPRWDAFWIVAGRVVDWGALPGEDQLRRRTAAALAKARGRASALKPEEVDEVRIVASWVASRMPEELPLEDGVDVVGFVAAATGSGERAFVPPRRGPRPPAVTRPRARVCPP